MGSIRTIERLDPSVGLAPEYTAGQIGVPALAEGKPSVRRPKRPLKLFAIAFGRAAGANYYYRVRVPAIVMRDLGLANLTVHIAEDITSAEMLQLHVETMMRQDVHFYYGRPSEGMAARIKTIKDMKPAKGGAYNQMTYPPSVIWSIDDNYHFVTPLNGSFLHHGTRGMDGKKLKPGDSVHVAIDGRVGTLWEDGKSYGGQKFDIEANLKAIEDMDRLLASCDGVSFTTQRLADFYREQGVEQAYVFPNSIYFPDYAHWRGYDMVRRDKSAVKVLWQGGASHYEDWFSIAGGLKRISKNLPQVQWTIWGAQFKGIHEIIPPSRFEYLQWTDYDNYKMILGLLDFDFCIAPLRDHIFNYGKSCIKFYEAAALPKPRPTLAAAVPPYSDEIIDGETGLLYHDEDEFVEKFEQLATRPVLRDRLAANARQWLLENRDATLTVPPYYEWIMERRRAVTGEV